MPEAATAAAVGGKVGHIFSVRVMLVLSSLLPLDETRSMAQQHRRLFRNRRLGIIILIFIRWPSADERFVRKGGQMAYGDADDDWDDWETLSL